ncbi:hypothetical protein GCM10008932_11940 [Alkalibacterium iburiense]|uniref:RNA polymerase sigma-70 region 2 domain-containing protein n=1 Tax=Alkalibacterium iburiense TaxID=290589 RepID=A0ABN0XCT9_9LACT
MLIVSNSDKNNNKKVYKDISDPITDALVLKIQSGETDLYPLLMDRCKSLLTRSTYRCFIKGYDREDLYQEASLVLILSVKRFVLNKGMSFNQYVSLCLDNHFNRLMRMNNTIKRKSDRESLSLDSIIEETGYHLIGKSDNIDPSSVPIMKETLEEFFTDLSPFERKVYEYQYLGYSYDQIAEMIPCDREQAMSARHRCTDKFKRHFW